MNQAFFLASLLSNNTAFLRDIALLHIFLNKIIPQVQPRHLWYYVFVYP